MHQSKGQRPVRLHSQWLHGRQCFYIAVKMQAVAINAEKNESKRKKFNEFSEHFKSKDIKI